MIRYEIGKYALRDIQEDDLPLLLEWRNSPRIHSKMLTDHKITLDEHVAWFDRIKDEPIKKHFVFTYDGTPIGYNNCSGLDLERRTVYGSSYIGAPDKCPKNSGVVLFYMSNDYVFSTFDVIIREVKVFADNQKALRLEQLFGYEFDSKKNSYVEKDGERKLVLYGTLTKERWFKRRVEIADMFKLTTSALTIVADTTGGGWWYRKVIVVYDVDTPIGLNAFGEVA